LVFLLTETIVVAMILKQHNDGSPLGYINRFGIPLVVSIPWVLGMRGYSLAIRQFASHNGSAMTVLARQFLYTEIAAYMMLSFFWSAFAR
jgi:hypothetical protein